MNSRLEESVVLVTGGAGGLGSAIGEVLAAEGACLVIGDIRLAAAQTLAERLQEQGARVLPLELDVANEESIDAVICRIEDEFGRLDALVNNAGIDVTLPLQELSASDWLHILAVNLTGPFLLSRRALPLLLRQGGSIVNIVSTAGKRAWPNASAYHASKWGLLGLSHALHAELRSSNIKVTAVIAGGMRTPFLLDRFPDIDPANLQDPRNVAETVRFVLSLPAGSVIPEVMVLPMRETSWP